MQIKGRYLMLEDYPTHLCIYPTDEAICAKDYFLAMPHGEAEDELLEDLFANSEWSRFSAKELGALTDATLLCRDYETDQGGWRYNVGTVYSDIDFYQVASWIAEMYQHGNVLFSAAPSGEA